MIVVFGPLFGLQHGFSKTCKQKKTFHIQYQISGHWDTLFLFWEQIDWLIRKTPDNSNVLVILMTSTKIIWSMTSYAWSFKSSQGNLSFYKLATVAQADLSFRKEIYPLLPPQKKTHKTRHLKTHPYYGFFPQHALRVILCALIFILHIN